MQLLVAGNGARTTVKTGYVCFVLSLQLLVAENGARTTAMTGSTPTRTRSIVRTDAAGTMTRGTAASART